MSRESGSAGGMLAGLPQRSRCSLRAIRYLISQHKIAESFFQTFTFL